MRRRFEGERVTLELNVGVEAFEACSVNCFASIAPATGTPDRSER